MNNQNFQNNLEVPNYPMDTQLNYYNCPILNPASSTPQPTFHLGDPRLNYVNKSTTPTSTEQIPMYYMENRSNFDLALERGKDVEQKADDELYIETWLSKIGKIQINLDSTINIVHSEQKLPQRIKSDIKISSAKQALKKCLIIIKKLEETEAELKHNVETMPSFKWKRKTIDIGNLKDELISLMSKFENEQHLLSLKKSVNKRNKKRLAQKKRKVNKQKEVLIKLEKRKKLHEDIDQWLDNMKEAVERAKAEENMKKDADCVLAEVTKKKSDARKQLSLISALIKLRNVREHISIQRGEKTPTEDKSAFNKITEKLTNMWEDMSRIYMKEEQGLKIMLEENAAADNASQTSKADKVIQQWQYCIFGPKVIPSQVYWGLTSAENNLETFVAIRKSWDTFLNVNIGQGSKIPTGWVLPPTNPIDAWTKYLINEI